MGIPARWRVLLSGAGVMLCIGSAYSWSLFVRPLMALFGWSSVGVSVAFALMLFSVGVGGLFGGLSVDRFGPRRIGATGAGLWGLGSILAGVGTPHFGLPWLYATYGVIGGFGAGMAYIVPGATVTKWFPQSRGLANGCILLAFGLGSLVFNAIVDAVPHFGAVADSAGALIDARNAAIRAGHAFVFPPGEHGADIRVVMNVFIGAGAVMFVAGVLSALGLAVPPSGSGAVQAGRHEYRWREMLRTPAFGTIYAMLFVNGIAGSAMLGNAVPLYSELTASHASTAAIVYGWLAMFNGIGRLLWAWLSDELGRVPCLTTAFALEAAAIAALAFLHAAPLVMTAFALLLLCFGGILAIAPAVVADFYGTRFMGEDYGCMSTAFAIAGLGGPVIFGVLEDVTGSLTHAILPIAAVVAAATMLPLVAKRPPSELLPGDRDAGAAAAMR